MLKKFTALVTRSRLVPAAVVLLALPVTGWAQDALRCVGFGSLESISLTDWESGLGDWTVGTRQVANPETFDTPDWSVQSDLPDGRPGQAAFVPNLDAGDCEQDDQTGVLMLDSPDIELPGDILVPRVSVDHWFDFEPAQLDNFYDGGNLKISVNGGEFRLVPSSAIERAPYNGTLAPPAEQNTNPLATEDAYVGRSGSPVNAGWIQSWINLQDLASPGDTVRLRFDFGIDACDGSVGWYVDDVEFYSCTEEIGPSACGNSVLDEGEQCDDGNPFSGDGCSSTCQVETGWECTTQPPPSTIDDPGFEAGTPNPAWQEVSNNFQGSPICEVATCATGGGTGPFQGQHWAWLGGVPVSSSSVSQSVEIPGNVDELTFELEVPRCDSASDYMEVLIDNQEVFRVTGASPMCNQLGYQTQTVDISDFTDGQTHQLTFRSETFANRGGVSSFFVDQVAMPGSPSVCTRTGPSLTLLKRVINDDGGTASPSDWTLSASGPTSFSGPGPSVSSDESFEAGSYVLSESGGPPGYFARAWTCDGDGQLDGNTIQLSGNDAAFCTIVNDDVDNTRLTLVKVVINDSGGTAQPSDWTLRAVGPEDISGSGPTVDSGPGLTPGTYSLSERDGPDGYAASGWVCEGASESTSRNVTLVRGDVATCTITNDDIDAGIAINAGYAGSWFFPDTSGQGQFIDVEPVEQFMFLSWFTFTDEASNTPSEQRWLTAQGNYAGNTAVLELFETLGGAFNDPQEVTTSKVGQVTVVFSDCNTGELTYEIDTEGLMGIIPMERVIPGTDALCESLSGTATEAVDINVGMNGAWFDPATSGQGFFIDAAPDPDGGNFIFVSWFTFGENTASGQQWYTAQGGFTGSTAEIPVFETTGGTFNDPQTPETVPVGTLTLDFTDCSNATFSYSLDEGERTGDIPVTRVIPEAGALCEELTGNE